MSKIDFIQLIGVLLAAAGVVALTAAEHIFGRPLTRDERDRVGAKKSHMTWLPINLETVASAAVFLGGIGILTWSKFDLCVFLAHWLPDLPEALRLLMSCR